MIFRFSLYGFLKNQRYFEPFLILALRDAGLDFFAIGLLIAIRELTVNLLEIPSGAIADVCGRRGSMVVSFVAYIVSFVIFASAGGFWLFALAMGVFAIGETFRSGTHKAMIFAWLRAQGREDERTRIYGYTRSWSKYGSASMVIIAAGLVFMTQDYADLFLLSIVPYTAALVNLATYPRSLEPARDVAHGARDIGRHMWDALRQSIAHRPLRRLLGESMAFEGMFHAAKDYLQPVLAASAALLLADLIMTEQWNETQRTALLVGPVYVVLFLLAGVASRAAHVVSTRAGGDDKASIVLWLAVLGLYLLMLLAGLFGLLVGLIALFIGLHVVQNLWRPVLISRFDAHGDESQGATLLSIESQARRLATMILAPLIGLAVDAAGGDGQAGGFWPIGAIGAGLAIAALVLRSRRNHRPLIQEDSSPAPGGG